MIEKQIYTSNDLLIYNLHSYLLRNFNLKLNEICCSVIEDLSFTKFLNDVCIVGYDA